MMASFGDEYVKDRGFHVEFSLSLVLVSLMESQMPCFRDTQPVEGSTR